MPEQRYDRAPSRLTKTDATPQGGLSASAYLTRTGVLTYTYPDGRKVRELRRPEQVFAQDSLATLRGAPLTVGHPGLVTPDNYRTHAAGTIADDVRQDGRFVAATVRVQDRAAVEGVRGGTLVELSCGYTADVVQGRGTYDGEPYDAEQTNIRYNHVAIIGPNAGRAGPDCALKLDADAAYSEDAYTNHVTLEQLQAALAAMTAERDALKLKQDQAHGAEVAALKGAVAALEAEAATQKVRADKAEALLASAASPEAIDKAAAERAELIAKAKTLAGEKFDCTGKTPTQIRQNALAVSHPALKLDSDDAIRGAFEALSTQAAKADASAAQVRKAATPEQKADASSDEDPVVAAKNRMNSRKPAKAA